MNFKRTTIFGFGFGYCFKDKEIVGHFLVYEITIKL